MGPQQQLEQDYKDAFKAGQKDLVETLRLLKSELKNGEIAKRGELTDAEALVILQREAKRRTDSITQFQQGGRMDLVAKEQAQLETIQKYLPAQLSDSDLQTHVQAVLAEMKPAGPKEMGKVMSAVMQRVKGQADGNRVRALVTAALQPPA